MRQAMSGITPRRSEKASRGDGPDAAAHDVRLDIRGAEDSGGGGQPDPHDSDVHSDDEAFKPQWLERNLLGRSARRLSIEELLALQYDPPPPEEDDEEKWLDSKKVPKVIRQIVKVAAPTEVQEVEVKYRKRALCFYSILVMGFICYMVYAVWAGLQARRNPPTRISTSSKITWHLPNMVLCDDRVLSIRHALHSGWSTGYGETDGDKTLFQDLVKVLDHGCARKQGCFWFDFNRLYPLDISAPVTEKMVAMDLIYFPDEYNPNLHVANLPDVYAAHVVFTDQSMEKWCASSSKDAFKNVFPLPVSRLDDDTQRVYAFLTKQHVSELKPGDEDRFTAKSDSAVQYALNAESIPVTNGLSMIKGFTWFVPCNASDTSAHGDCRAQLGDTLEYATANNASAQAILLTFIQNELVVSYDEVDPFSIATLLGNIGGFWSYIGGLFALVYVVSESGKRRPHCLFRKRKWRKLGRRVRRSLSNAFMGGAAAARSRGRSKSTESKWASEDGDQQQPEGLASMAAPSISYAEDEDERRKEERLRQQSLEKRVYLLERILKSVVQAKLLVDPHALAAQLDPSAAGNGSGSRGHFLSTPEQAGPGAVGPDFAGQGEIRRRGHDGDDWSYHSVAGSSPSLDEAGIELAVGQPGTPAERQVQAAERLKSNSSRPKEV